MTFFIQKTGFIPVDKDGHESAGHFLLPRFDGSIMQKNESADQPSDQWMNQVIKYAIKLEKDGEQDEIEIDVKTDRPDQCWFDIKFVKWETCAPMTPE